MPENDTPISKAQALSSGFVKRELRLLPLTEAEFEADFWTDTAWTFTGCNKRTSAAESR